MTSLWSRKRSEPSLCLKHWQDQVVLFCSKAAYLSKLIENGIDEVKHYDKSMFESISSETLQLPIHTKLNKLKKTLGEAFFYWLEIQKIVNE